MSELTYNEFKDFFLAPINEFKDAEKMKEGVYVNSEVFRKFYLNDQGLFYRNSKRIFIDFRSLGDGVYWIYPIQASTTLFDDFRDKK